MNIQLQLRLLIVCALSRCHHHSLALIGLNSRLLANLGVFLGSWQCIWVLLGQVYWDILWLDDVVACSCSCSQIVVVGVNFFSYFAFVYEEWLVDVGPVQLVEVEALAQPYYACAQLRLGRLVERYQVIFVVVETGTWEKFCVLVGVDVDGEALDYESLMQRLPLSLLESTIIEIKLFLILLTGLCLVTLLRCFIKNLTLRRSIKIFRL